MDVVLVSLLIVWGVLCFLFFGLDLLDVGKYVVGDGMGVFWIGFNMWMVEVVG